MIFMRRASTRVSAGSWGLLDRSRSMCYRLHTRGAGHKHIVEGVGETVPIPSTCNSTVSTVPVLEINGVFSHEWKCDSGRLSSIPQKSRLLHAGVCSLVFFFAFLIRTSVKKISLDRPSLCSSLLFVITRFYIKFGFEEVKHLINLLYLHYFYYNLLGAGRSPSSRQRLSLYYDLWLFQTKKSMFCRNRNTYPSKSLSFY